MHLPSYVCNGDPSTLCCCVQGRYPLLATGAAAVRVQLPLPHAAFTPCLLLKDCARPYTVEDDSALDGLDLLWICIGKPLPQALLTVRPSCG
jgi:hypothetical protein